MIPFTLSIEQFRRPAEMKRDRSLRYDRVSAGPVMDRYRGNSRFEKALAYAKRIR